MIVTYPAQFDFAAKVCLLQRDRKGIYRRSTEPQLAHLLLNLSSATDALQSRMQTLTASNACAAHTCRPCSQAQPLRPLRVLRFQHSRRLASRTRRGHVTQMGLKAVETFNASFELQPEAETAIHQLLASQAFCKQVVKECQLEEGSEVKFSGQLFQPVPWSVTSRKGMPPEFEKYSDNPKFTIINIPPNFMFQAKIFKPSRLCAIYERL